ncbi:unnamed protein product [Ilex paraguariensis]|uniref:Zeaxanthin epoxidase n=1 Tax=Ilex paraguariensis TaxID=185542 RepID=A0ABC8TJF1_9AQUA
MASTVVHSSINPSTPFLSRAHFPFQISKHFSPEFFPSVHYKNYFRGKESWPMKKKFKVKATVTEAPPSSPSTQSDGDGTDGSSSPPSKNLKILVAGGGIGGLVFALAAKRKGFEVVVFEKDLSAVRGEGQYRGPIQVQSNALAALEAIDMDVADEIMKAGCITGDRINGLVDGISGNW